MSKVKRVAALVLEIVIPLVVALLALCVGRYALTPLDVITTLIAGPSPSEPGPATMVVFNVRLPRILLAFIVGAGLSVVGCCFQSIFSNPLASPDTLGVSAGAAFGASLAILFSFSIAGVQAFALCFGIVAIVFTFLLSSMRKGSGILMVVLAGVITSAFFNALISAIKYLADPTTKLPEITYWLMGSMVGASYFDLSSAVPLICIPCIILIMLRWKLNVLMLPENESVSLGIKPRTLRWIIIVLGTLIVASCVSVCGQVGWVGLVIPHMARRLVGTDHQYLLPASISMGGVYLLLIDTLARSLTSGELPLSILTAIIGLPIFVVLYFRKGARGFDA
ncbi:MAG: iron ABC transporter permease [Coriobacteriales bacterium]|nr:iron ABC transporter permease [Coriobacteriales bacterium]